MTVASFRTLLTQFLCSEEPVPPRWG